MSEKLLPIVPGCKALTYNCIIPSNNNRIVTVIMKTGVMTLHSNKIIWETDYFSMGTAGRITPYFAEDQLMRIDGGDFKHERDSYELPMEKTA